jgi:hypothetical protein
MSAKIIKKCFKENDDKLYLNSPPILYRQIASSIIYDRELNIFIDYSSEINDVLRQKAYSKECLKEYLKKYKNYKTIIYSIHILKKTAENKLPYDIILEIVKYL